jgi:hypothetical protein
LRSSFNSADCDDEFSNTAELRLELKYQVTGAIFLKVGYTAIWIDHIARAAKSYRHASPTMATVEQYQGGLFPR